MKRLRFSIPIRVGVLMLVFASVFAVRLSRIHRLYDALYDPAQPITPSGNPTVAVPLPVRATPSASSGITEITIVQSFDSLYND